MKALQLVKIKENEVKNTVHCVGTLIYCTDTKRCFFDHEDGSRYSDMETNLIIKDVKSEFYESNLRYFNKVYIELSKNKFYKFNFDLNDFELIYSDTEFETIIKDMVGSVPATMYDNGTATSNCTLASNVYYKDGTTTLEEMLNKDLYITTTKVKYVEATVENQRCFKIPFPVAKYSLYRDHMHVVAPNSRILTPDDYKVNCGFMVINQDKPGIAKGEKLYFLFYYTRTTNTSESQVVGTDNINDGSITTDKLSPDIEINADRIIQEDNLQFVNQIEKETLAKMKDFKITELDADVIVENDDRMFVDSVMYELLYKLLYEDDDEEDSDDAVANIKYKHPDTHPASMIILRELNQDLEQYVNNLHNVVLTNKVNITDGTIETSPDQIFKPGNYTVLLGKLQGLPVEGIGTLTVTTSTGKEFTGIANTWATQRFVLVDNSDENKTKTRLFIRSCANSKSIYGDWSEILTTGNSVEKLETDSKDIISAINEVFTLANNVKTNWADVIGFPLDHYDTCANLLEKTTNIKKRLADILISNGLSCSYTQTLQELVNLTPSIGENNRVRTGLIRSSSTTCKFEEGDGTSFNEYYVEVPDLQIPLCIVNIYNPEGELHASFKKNGNGIYSIGRHNNTFIESSGGAYIGSGFKIPVEEYDSNYRYYATPIATN